MDQLLLSEVARKVAGSLVGTDGTKRVAGIRPMDEAGPSDLTFLSNAKYRKAVPALAAGAILVSEPLPEARIPQIVVASPYLALAILMQHFYPLPGPASGISPAATVHPDATVHPSAEIRAGCVIEKGAVIGKGTLLFSGVTVGEGARIGEDCILYPGSAILDRVRIGHRVIVQSGSVIGSDGFGYAERPDGSRIKIPQVGTVVLEDDVEIGANVTIDRATFGETRIGRGTKIDNLVQIAHNVRTGEHCVIVSQTGVAGSAKLGDRVVLAGQVGVVGHIEIGSNSTVGAQTGVSHSLPAGSRVSGTPAVPHSLWLRIQAVLKQLPEIAKRVTQLEKSQIHSKGASHGTD